MYVPNLHGQRYWLYMLDILAVFTVIGLLFFGFRYAADSNDTAICKTQGKVRDIYLQQGVFSSEKLTINRCDMLRITNRDGQAYKLAFGDHDKHMPYPGFSEQLINSGKTATIQAVKIGEYHMHDHLQDHAHLDVRIRAR